MATIIVKKRKTLSLPDMASDKPPAKTLTLKPKAKAAPKAKKPTGEELNEAHNAEQTRLRQERIKKAKEWLISSWPELFDPQNTKPLGLTVGKSIQAEYSQAKKDGLDFGWVHVSTALARWVRHSKYAKALKTATHRYNLDGTQAEEIKDDERKPRAWEKKKKV
ncbi:ProQ/FinO family protein [Vibrio anguillarum]|uniref:ProQ/FINO family protein n=1 Tax=Vibrio anguillarum TaxID=55601 RepID=UPI001D17D549|nr:ProQ/FINO family protein [Vibrio anguillarum]MCC4238158.1 ProQ/FinO family protein [Vibrio anguillarum]